MGSRAVVEPVAYGGWAHNIRLANDEVEAVVTLDVGPRVIRLARPGGDNAFKEVPEQLGTVGEDHWVMRGGHRLWVSPEDPARTYDADNHPLTHALTHGPDGVRLRVTQRPDARTGLEKSIELLLPDSGPSLSITHRLRNVGDKETTLAPWALTVMEAGGHAVVPLAPFRPHPGDAGRTAADYAPSQPLVLWPYFRFNDPRFRFGTRFIRIRHDSTRGPAKIGLGMGLDPQHPEAAFGYAAYQRGDATFVKRFAATPGAPYPDSGCTFETYTDSGILELESLGPLTTVARGAEVLHTETWWLLGPDGTARSGSVPRFDANPDAQRDDELAGFFERLFTAPTGNSGTKATTKAGDKPGD